LLNYKDAKNICQVKNRRKNNTVDQEDEVGAMRRLDLFLSAQKSLESTDQVQTGSF
jgi:hypothetical protein